MKKFLAVVMTAVLAMSMMTACGSSKSSKENKDTTAAKAETTQAETIDASEVTLVSDGVLTVMHHLKHFRKMERHLKDLILILLQKLLRD